MKKLYFPSQIYDFEKSLFASGIDELGLMKDAANAAAQWIISNLKQKIFIILVGPGNNGGDGIYIGKYLIDHGYKVYFLRVLQEKAKSNLTRAAEKDIKKHLIALVDLDDFSKQETVIVDAMLGIGGRETISNEIKSVNKIANTFEHKIAIDAPTGLNVSSGNASKETFLATNTLTFFGYKIGQILDPGKNFTGKMELLKLNKNIDEEMTEAANLFSFEDVKDLLPKRKLDSHKGMFGKIAILAGDAGYEGAGILASAGALSVGAGLVRLFSQENAITPALSYLPELMVSGSDNPQDFKDDIKSAEVIVCGPGFKDSYWSEQLLYMAIESAKENNQTLIMDAGALRLLCNKPFQDTDLPSKLILTPHPGEAAALLNLSTEEIQKNRLSASTNLATKFKASIVLKGYQTVVSSNANYICNEGSPALSIPGSGDILAGIIAGLIGNKLDSLSAIKLAVAVHGRSGTEYSKNFGDRGLDAKTLIGLIKKYIN